jgi:hypothetical protein
MLKRAHWIGVAGVALIAPLAGVLHAGCQSTCELDSDCPQGTFCFLGPGQCAQAVPLGFCTDIADHCTAAAVPVCGCDNRTYLNACVASRNGQAQATSAACVNSPCLTNGDCQKDEVCSFTTVGICPGEGVSGSCVVKPTKCEDSLSAVCGCDGKTYQNVCEMQKAGVSELSATACSCQDNSQCGADQFCSFGGTAGSGCLGGAPMGTCAFRPKSCSTDVQEVCGCDGNTYQNGCLASKAGTNVAFMTACTASMLPDAGADGGDGGDGG